METDLNFTPPITSSSRRVLLADWLDDPSEDMPRNLQIVWLTRRFGLSPTFARGVAELAFERRPGR